MQSSKKFDPEKQLSELFHGTPDTFQHCPLLLDLLSNYLRHLIWTTLDDFCNDANLYGCLTAHTLFTTNIDFHIF